MVISLLHRLSRALPGLVEGKAKEKKVAGL